MDTSNWVLQFLGRLHPLLVHFPIGLLVVALLLEILTIGGKRKGLREGINWMIYIGAGFAVFSALFGWFLKTQEAYTGDLVDNHQYTGIATSVLAIVTAIILKNSLKKTIVNLKAYRFMLFATVVLLTIAGHLGANLTHGEDYLTAVFPGSKEGYSNKESGALLSELKGADSLSGLQKDKLNLEVRGLFAHKCYQCHSENKQKGELVLETKQGVFKGGKSGLAIVPGNPEESEIYKRIILPSDNKKVMPTKGKLLTADEIALVKLWITEGAHWSDKAVKVFPEAKLSLLKPELPKVEDITHPIDKLIAIYFDKNNLDWQEVIDDRAFIRRAYLDAVGLLPEPSVVKDFVNDNNPNKREALVDALLNDNQNYTQHWLSFWNDLLRNDYYSVGGKKQITDWLYNSLIKNKSYDQIVTELVNPVKGSEGFIQGVKWRGVVNASQRTEMQAAQNIGQSLMGVNVKCASCHNSFISNLTLDQAYGFATIFSDSILELNRCDKPIGKMAKANFLYPELGNVEGETVKDRLLKLSEVMVQRDNGRLYRTIANRFWDRLMGRGIVEPLDEMDNVPWDADVLDWLSADFIDSGSDLKHLIKQIMTSRVYQLPMVNYKKAEDLKTKYVFKGPVTRRLSAEQFSDAVSQIIAPLYPQVAFNPNGDDIKAIRIWHLEEDLGRVVLPEPGKRYFRKSFQVLRESVKKAKILISVDNSYVLYLNGKKILENNNSKVVDKIDITNDLNKVKNTIAIIGKNEGTIANPAGILFALKLEYESGKSTILKSDKSWVSSRELPKGDWTALNYNDSSWLKVRDYSTRNFKNWGQLLDFTFKPHNEKFARASLVKQHPFMKALGRPSREIVTTSREDQATLLQALELTNGEFFNSILEEGAQSWLKKYGEDSNMMVENLYQKALSRNPMEEEKKIMLNVLGETPKQQQLQDVFWAILMSPEFQFIN
ncbi:DUF1549 domain-containing protein [Hyunsoonleella pacifica]|uniref:DUF1553 domain-containing protein n=1 Tax=Hyunsoonleella pacifica TaxID=1080224 RepID=A0A4Q9FSD5_9FLAO|nr:DUF1549 domain-containing protein [Hyunsoonleella pacifica]TBN18736.1 DUF1553 domain-containing protein [Hyunsoonleella pacifica]GGD04291.1 hypothetical protein GCM10011368_02660 [Hyunsoonleella pacifica]